MAKVKFTAFIAEVRNKLSGSVFARNRSGAYIRTKVTPVNPKTQAQAQARSRLTQFAQKWRSLTQAQRDAWNSVTNQWAKTDVFGDVVNPSGNALFNRLNINITLAGGTAIDVPPLPVGAAGLTSLSLVANETANEMEIAILPATVPADHALYVESTANMSPGIANASSKLRHIQTEAAASASPVDLSAKQVLKFGGLIQGQKVFVRAKLINMTTGEVSQALSASAIVGA